MKRTPLKKGTKTLKRSGFKRKPTKTLKRALKRKIEGKKGVPRCGIKSISKLKKELWKYFSLYIRQRDKFTCFTCGRKGEGSGMHAGHFVPKSIGGIALYFHEDNVHAQCYNCNINLGGNHYIYGKKLGEEKAEELYRIKNQVSEKWTTEDYQAKILYYKRKIELQSF